MIRSFLAFATVGLVVSACATVSTNSTGGKYSENLSAYRPVMETAEPQPDTTALVNNGVEVYSGPSMNVNNELQSTLDSLAVYKRENVKYIDGFTIQVYGGSSRNNAREARMSVLRYFPDTDPRMIFDQPNYKVRIGEFYSRLDAQPLFIDIRRRFRYAILVPTRISID
jgi:hypothetical protein